MNTPKRRFTDHARNLPAVAVLLASGAVALVLYWAIIAAVLKVLP